MKYQSKYKPIYYIDAHQYFKNKHDYPLSIFLYILENLKALEEADYI